jgi:8-oxo-dGTP pyrophosphatase MutT (NUDIX family)
MTLDVQKASTVVLCNITTKWPHKVLLVKRSEKAQFLPGAHVFPGGRVEKKDEDFANRLLKSNDAIARINQYFPTSAQQISLYLAAAIRETLEEAFVSIIKELSPALLKKMIEGQEDARFRPSLTHIWPISWWITPKSEVRRFDTWFFLALVHDSMASAASDMDHNETSDLIWLDPKEALNRYVAQELFLAPPTRAILERMAQTSDLTEFLSYVDCPLRPISPYFVEDDVSQGKLLVLPGDPLHHEKQRLSLPLHTRYVFP